MRVTAALLGGGRRYLYPRTVWSPSGGWWNNAPPNAERNGVIAALAIAAGVAVVFNVSRRHEVCRATNVPSLMRTLSQVSSSCLAFMLMILPPSFALPCSTCSVDQLRITRSTLHTVSCGALMLKSTTQLWAG